MDGTWEVRLSLERIRETQYQHGAILTDLAAKQERLTLLLTQRRERDITIRSTSTKTKSPSFWRDAALTGVSAGAQYGVGIISIHYLVQGGDALKLLQVVLKALVGGS